MSETAEYISQLAQSYIRLSHDYIAQAQAYDDLNRLFSEAVKRADAAEARVKELEASGPDTERLDWLQANFVIFTIDNPTLQGQPIRKVIDAARQHGGDATPTYQTSDVVRARLEQQAAMQNELNPLKQGGVK